MANIKIIAESKCLRGSFALMKRVLELSAHGESIKNYSPKIVVMVLRDNEKILFGKRAEAEAHLKGWTPASAGGHIEKGETAEEAVVREAREELGVDVEVARFLGQIEHREHVLVFECKLLRGEIKPDPREIEEIRWVPIEQANRFSDNTLSKKILNILFE